MSRIIALRKTSRIVGLCATPILTRPGAAFWRSLVVIAMLALSGSALAGATNTPYTDTFEEYTNGTPLIDGTNAWYGSSSDIIVTNIVRTIFGAISTNAAMIPVDGTLSNRCTSTHGTGVFIQVDANLEFYEISNSPAVDTNVTAMFYVDSNGYFVVHNGAANPTPTNSINWVTLKTDLEGQPIDPLSANTNVRINLRQNYQDKTWALYANNVLLTNAIGFINTAPTNFTGFDLYNGSTTSYLDNVAISDWQLVMEVSPTNIDRAVWQGQDAGSNQVEVWNNNGTNAMSFSNSVIYTNCGTYTNWLTVTPVTGTNYGETHKSALWVRMNTTNLPPRTNAYEANVQVTAEPGMESSPQYVRVTVLVQGVGLWVSTNNYSKVMTEGQTAWDVFRVANTGDVPRGTMSYTLTATSWPTAWLSVSPSSGWVIDDTNNVTVTYATTGLTPLSAPYTGRVDVVALGVGTQSVNVTLQLNRRPVVAWDAGSKAWTNEVLLGSSLAGTNLAVWNGSGQPAGRMSYRIYVVNDQSGWVGVSPDSGVSTGNQQVATVSYTTTGLVAGVYTAQLMVEGRDEVTGELATNGPLSVGLQLTVKGSLPVIKTDKASLSQTVLQNNTVTNSFLVWNEGRWPRGGMRYTVTPDADWVTVLSNGSGVVTNSTNSVQVVWGLIATTLESGTNYGNLVVQAWDASTETPVTSVALPLTLIVEPRTPMNLELPTVVGTMYIGQTVTNNVGIWKNQERLTFTFQWQRATTRAGGSLINLGTSSTQQLIYTKNGRDDRGKYLRVAVTATDAMSLPSMNYTAYSAWTNAAKVKALHADLNSDGITDLWFYDQLSGTWRLNFGTASSAAGVWPRPIPGQLMEAVPGDYNGDGIEDLGVYDPANGMWHALLWEVWEEKSGSLFNEVGATPMPADYDGDGITDLAFYLEGYWGVLYSSIGWPPVVVAPFAEGAPVMGDWDGDGTTDMGVYANGIWTLRLANGDLVDVEFGGSGAGILPAPGDYDGDGATDMGVHDVNVNKWSWRSSETGTTNNESFGPCGGWPTPGYYDHDAKEDFAQVFSYQNDFYVWLVKRTMETNFQYRGQSYQHSTDRWRVSW